MGKASARKRLRVVPGPWQPLQPATLVPKSEAEIAEMVEALGPHGYTEAQVREQVAQTLADSVWINDAYQVHVRRIPSTHENSPGLVHLSIRRHDREPVRDWRDMQRIKNQLVGPECEGVELYPAESRLVDSANQYHVWVIDDPKFRFPFGFGDRFVLETDASVAGSRQRAFDE